jgi:hypothetical protein
MVLIPTTAHNHGSNPTLAISPNLASENARPKMIYNAPYQKSHVLILHLLLTQLPATEAHTICTNYTYPISTMKFTINKLLIWALLVLVATAKSGGDYACHGHEGETKCGKCQLYPPHLRYRHADVVSSRRHQIVRHEEPQDLLPWAMAC